jgi:hypothetical protein
MSYCREEPFDVSSGGQDDWIVDFEGEPVHVDNHADAMLLADLPVQLCKAVSKDQKPDLHRIELVLALCDEYHLDHRFGAVRQLMSWFEQNHGATVNKNAHDIESC